MDAILYREGKVRNVYYLTEQFLRNLLFMVFTDRVSANDRVVGEIKDKGKVLWILTVFFKQLFSDIIENDIVSHDQEKITSTIDIKNMDRCSGRMLIVQKAIAIPMECIVRGYFTGSFAKAYAEGKAWTQGFSISLNIQKNDKLVEPIFTPSTKGEKDEYLPKVEMIEFLRSWLDSQKIELNAGWLYNELKKYSLKLFIAGKQYTDKCGITLLDAKFEFGLVKNSDNSYKIIWIDEGITPDTARLRLKETLEGLDKDDVRKDVAENGFLGKKVAEKTRQKYLKAARMLAPALFAKVFPDA
ncbi:MAG: phosphoribosylaminoimidazolesuccinocarboxamide synthase [Candidatus Pacebacteria bacterium]|nr:phosphoribosylaminoimidazolesuccinocarboxamide synthase [Candidatus Paceibacterota bacterium]